MIGNYVLYPPLLRRAENDIKFFTENGIKVLPTLFYGTFNNKTYPFYKGVVSYSEKEIEFIKKYNPQAIKILKNRKNIPCHAGSTAFAVSPEYNVTPCVMIKKRIGHFYGEWKRFSKVLRCPINYCTCAFNEDFLVSRRAIQPKHLIEETISKNGTFSSLESFKSTFSFDQLLINFAHRIGCYYTMKNIYRKYYRKPR